MPDTAQSRAQRRQGASLIRKLKNCTATFVGGQLQGILLDTLDNPALGEMSMQARLITLRVLDADATALGLPLNEGDAVQVVSLLSGVSTARKIQSVERDHNTGTIRMVLKR